ncbi:hypothetical protein QBC40DRAFT_43959 [Triangularia verruculosa]|uniref:Uncharacterized protein n=1 Tax=Triangularia verruculosa TaxID=2587418 RepID=A0AAN6XL39_9PEZI|nr:hypothetical protein QBC40DRAFT_43959 [Triangularia verruculosa]
MYLCAEVKRLYSSLQEMITSRRGALRRHGRGGSKRQLVISEPFNFEHRPVTLPGLTPEEILVLREKAAATRLGIHTDSPPTLPTYSVSAPSSSSNSSTTNPNVTGILPPLPHPIITSLHTTSGPGRSSSRAGSSMRSSSARSGTISRSESMARIPYPSNLRHYASSEHMKPMPMPIPSGGGLPTQSNHSLLLLGDLDDDIVSPLELDSGYSRPSSRGRVNVHTNIDTVGMFPLDLDFEHLEREFELGSPISPLSPPKSQKNTPRGSPKGSVSEKGGIRI